MSFQEQQPGFSYPNTVTSSSNSSPSSHSKGSFGEVFIVLAVIVVLSAMACFLSRLCNRKHHHQSPKKSHQHGPPVPRPEKREPKQGHHEKFNDKDIGDIEFGFEKGFPNGKQIGKGETAKGTKNKPKVRFEFGGDSKGVGEREA